MLFRVHSSVTRPSTLQTMTIARSHTMAVSIILVAAFLVGCDQPLKSADRVMQHSCQKNLKRLYSALQQYAKDNQNQLPNDWTQLVQSGVLSLSSNSEEYNPLVCPGSALTANSLPSSNQEWLAWIRRGDVSYVIIASGKQMDATRREAIVVEKTSDHLDDGGFVLYSDGSIKWSSEKEIAELLGAITKVSG